MAIHENTLPALSVIFEDNHLVAVIKPHNLLTQGDSTGDPNLLDLVKAYIKEKYQKPGNVFIGLVHRLDRPAGGVVLFARTSKAASRLSDQFRKRTVAKTYHAIVEGIPDPEEGERVDFLAKDKRRKKTRRHERYEAGDREARLSYRLVANDGARSLLEVKPVTGRPHQIRVQLSSMGHPIEGDKKYGARASLPDRSVRLYATRLEVAHPVTGEPVILEAPLPDHWPLARG